MKFRRNLLLMIGAVAVIAILLVGLGLAAVPKGKDAPNFKARTLNGAQFELKDLRGRVVVLDFWATWCPPCRKQAPQLEKLWQRYRDKGVVVIGLAQDSGAPEELRQFAADNKLNYWIASDGDGAIARDYGVIYLPTTYLVSPTGHVSRLDIGYTPGMERQLEKELKDLLPSPAQLAKLKPLPK